MPYIIEVVKAGNTIEVSKYYSSRFNKKGVKRGKRKQLTTDEQREVNKRAAEKKLRRLINENFQEGDTHLVLDYKLSERPAGRKAMRADADDFLQEMRKLYKSLGLVFKYIHGNRQEGGATSSLSYKYTRRSKPAGNNKSLERQRADTL